TPGGENFVRWHPCRDKNQAVQSQRGRSGPCRRQMPQMGRIKGPAVDPDLHNQTAFPQIVLIVLTPIQPPDYFTSLIRLSFSLLWVSRYSTNLVPMTCFPMEQAPWGPRIFHARRK